MHLRSSWQPSGDLPTSTAVRACVSSTYLGLDVHPRSHQGGEPPRGLRLEAQEGGERQAPTQRVRDSVGANTHGTISSCCNYQTCPTTYRCASDHRKEAASITEATQGSQGRASALGHTPGGLQAPCQAKEDTSSYTASQGARRPKEDGGED